MVKTRTDLTGFFDEWLFYCSYSYQCLAQRQHVDPILREIFFSHFDKPILGADKPILGADIQIFKRMLLPMMGRGQLAKLGALIQTLHCRHMQLALAS